MEYQGTLR